MKDNIWIIFVAIEFFFRGKWFHGADLPKRKERRILQARLATPDLASKRTDWFYDDRRRRALLREIQHAYYTRCDC
jgi:hypothetical protein